jgi:tetratricopeptide (TPR) repeat protein
MILLFVICYFHRRKPIHQVKQFMGFRQYSEAKAILDDLISTDPDPALVNLRAICELNLNDTDSCLVDATASLQTSRADQERKSASATLVQLFVRMGNYPEAASWADRSGNTQFSGLVASLASDEAAAAAGLARGELTASAALFDRLLKESPLRTDFLVGRAEAAWGLRDFAAFKRLAAELLARLPGNETVEGRLGVIAVCDGDLSWSGGGDGGLAAARLRAIERMISECFAQNDTAGILRQIVELNMTAAALCPAKARLRLRGSLHRARFERLVGRFDDALSSLSAIAGAFGEDAEFLREKATVELELRHYDEAIKLFTKAGDAEGVARANLMKRRSYYIDWYAYLGLNRDKGATFDEIRTAYRRIVRVWHPDRFKNRAKRAEAERLMKRINSAYDILMNPKLKERYDSGFDPYNPDSTKPTEFNPVEEFFAKNKIKPVFPEGGPLKITIQM